MMNSNSGVSIRLTADACWIPLVQSVIENGAPVLGLTAKKTLDLTLAAEEFLLHLSNTSPGTALKMILNREASRVSAQFQFESSPADLWAMNLTAAGEITRDLDQGMDHMGLLLMSRVVDHFFIDLKGRKISVTLYQEIEYPEMPKTDVPPSLLKGPLYVSLDSDSAEISHACTLVTTLYPESLYPRSFRTPGKVIDRISGGNFHAGILKDQAGRIAGMIYWRNRSEKTVEFYGPYAFSNQENHHIAGVLINHMIGSLARSTAITLYSRMATEELPSGSFEPLARFKEKEPDGQTRKRTLWFRHLREDIGCHVWAHPSFAPFLRKTYDTLFLMRTVREYQGSGENRPERSLLGTKLDAERKEAFLRPMIDGTDIRENIARHVKLLVDENFLNIFLTIDLSVGWQTVLGEALAANGFSPAYVLPYAGQSDEVIFQYVSTDA